MPILVSLRAGVSAGLRSVMRRMARSVSSGEERRSARPKTMTLTQRAASVTSSTWKQTSWLAAMNSVLVPSVVKK